jgi:DUF1680 family protein
MTASDGPVVNFYGAMKARAPLPGGGDVALEQVSGYPLDNPVQLTLHLDAPRDFTLRLRIPAWSEQSTLAINGAAQAGPTAGRYAAVRRTWHDGDVVTLRLDLRARIAHAPGRPDFAAILRGPLVLARDARLDHGSDVNAPVVLAPDASGHIGVALVAGRADHGIWQRFVINASEGSASALQLCDFASAGNTWNTASTYRVWLPLASGGGTASKD